MTYENISIFIILYLNKYKTKHCMMCFFPMNGEGDNAVIFKET